MRLQEYCASIDRSQSASIKKDQYQNRELSFIGAIMLRVFLIIVLGFISGCIVVPVVELEPYQNGVTEEIIARETSREEVINILGKPSVTRENDRIWIYAEARHLAYFFVLGKIPSGDFVDEYQFVVMEFDQDTVKSYEIIENSWGCSSSGICLESGWHYSNQQLVPEETIISNRGRDDQEAKNFNSDTDKCSLYVYTTGGEAVAGRLFVDIDAIPATVISSGLYLYSRIQPGQHSILFRSVFGEIQKHQIECERGDVLFVELYMKRIHKFSFRPRVRHEVHSKLVNYDKGSKAIEQRHLVVRT
ncbi:MAG: hypothetical protein ABJK25_13835 [Halieaceae bacterium]